jgi:hypothetical protein
MPVAKWGRYAKWLVIAYKARYALLAGGMSAGLQGATAVGCGDDSGACDEGRGYVCRAGVGGAEAGASGEAGQGGV